ncbi:hypothetical protein AN191_13980 [Loktanella sp. 5RATIMAR09]|nr:hypothetical protein AN191_13980 [Loktanella sp. 5RATIMAR09]
MFPLAFTLIGAGLGLVLSHFNVAFAEFGFDGLLFFSTFVTLFALVACIFAIPAIEIAIHFGKAGWLVAVGTGVCLALIMYDWLFDYSTNTVGTAVFGTFGALFGAVFWVAARLSTPKAFVRGDDA